MFAKLVVTAENRQKAFRKLSRILEGLILFAPKSNVSFLYFISSNYSKVSFSTDFIKQNKKKLFSEYTELKNKRFAATNEIKDLLKKKALQLEQQDEQLFWQKRDDSFASSDKSYKCVFIKSFVNFFSK